MTVSRQIHDIAEGVFLADASAVESDGRIPDAHFAALAAAGLYGAFAPVEMGGAGLDVSELCDAVEQLASGCLTSTFVWIQHFGLLGTVLDPTTPEALREQLLVPVVKGEVRGGLALAGLLPGPPVLRAERVDGGWRLHGESRWVSGWGYVQLLLVVARQDETSVLTVVVDALDGPGLTSERMHLMAADASMTARLRFDALFVPDDRVVRVGEFDPDRAQSEGLRLNGSLALGLIRRCCAILGPSPLDDELARARKELDEAAQADMPHARAAAAALAVRAAASLMVALGSSASLAGADAERLAREASFTLVFGSRPRIKAALREVFAR